MIEPVRLYRDHPQDRVAAVSVTPAFDREGEWLLRVARGASAATLQSAGVYGPYGEAELQARFDGVVDGLRAEGFESSGLVLTLAELQDPSRKRRALAARRLGWRLSGGGASSKDVTAAVDALLAAGDKATEELCTILDALGLIGDDRAIPLLRKYAERKLLSRRRSGVEALRGLGDAEGLAAARQRAIEALEPTLREALLSIDESAGGDAVKTLRDAVVALPGRRRGRAADTLYELGSPAAIAAARKVLAKLPVERAYVWRYVKSVLKRAMLRHDPATLGFLALRVERAAARVTGSRATVKSGRDGKKRDTVIFGRKTQRYVLRSIWRHLSFMARHRPERYPETAAEILIRYRHQDAAKPTDTFGAFSRCYFLHRILWGASPRYRLLDGSLRWRRQFGVAVEGGAREESHPGLWDAQPRAYLRLLAKARLVEVQEFAVQAVRERHDGLLEEAGLEQLQAMLKAPYPPTVELALAELQRRFDADAPDWTLVLYLAEDERDWVRAVAHDWLRATAPLWTRHSGPTISWLDARHADVRFLAADLAAAAMAGATLELRRELADLLLERLQSPETEEGQHDAYAPVAAALAAEIDGRLSLAEVMALIEEGSGGARAVAGAVLGRRPEAFDELGERRVLNLAEDELVAVRGAAQALFGAVRERFRDNPSLLFVLVESQWQDNRVFALGELRELDLSRLGLDGLLALCDSNRVDVQEMGKDLVRRSFEELDAELVTRRLAEHPHRNVRRFVVELLASHLEPGAEALRRLDGLFRAVLFDLQPERRLKRVVVDFLVERGEADAAEAAVVARILDDAVHSSIQADFEHALVALTRLRLAQPATASLVTLTEAEP